MPRRSTELLQEFIVIVTGVFVALAAESWWSEREDRQIEREIREDRVAEFEANIRILEADPAQNEGARPRIAFPQGLSEEALMALADEQMTGMHYPAIRWPGSIPRWGQSRRHSPAQRQTDDGRPANDASFRYISVSS